MLPIIVLPIVVVSSIARKVAGFYNLYATENNSDLRVSIQRQIEINNRKTIAWTLATVLLGLLFWL